MRRLERRTRFQWWRGSNGMLCIYPNLGNDPLVYPARPDGDYVWMAFVGSIALTDTCTSPQITLATTEHGEEMLHDRALNAKQGDDVGEEIMRGTFDACLECVRPYVAMLGPRHSAD